MSNGEDQSLLERVEMPTIPREAARKIALVEEEFTRAEVEQRMYLFSPRHVRSLHVPSRVLRCVFSGPAIGGSFLRARQLRCEGIWTDKKSPFYDLK